MSGRKRRVRRGAVTAAVSAARAEALRWKMSGKAHAASHGGGIDRGLQAAAAQKIAPGLQGGERCVLRAHARQRSRSLEGGQLHGARLVNALFHEGLQAPGLHGGLAHALLLEFDCFAVRAAAFAFTHLYAELNLQ